LHPARRFVHSGRLVVFLVDQEIAEIIDGIDHSVEFVRKVLRRRISSSNQPIARTSQKFLNIAHGSSLHFLETNTASYLDPAITDP
jgi:hypothetical protein